MQIENARRTPVKTLGVFAIVMINIIAVDSLRSLPFSAVYGFSLIFYYLLCAVMFFVPSALVAAELATAWPAKGGIYVWVREAFGELWGFVVIWLQWVYNIVWYPTILAFLAGTLAYLIAPSWANSKVYMIVSILIIFWSATILNFFGMRVSSLVSAFGAILGTLLPMLFIILLGGIWIAKGEHLQIHSDWHSFWPDLSNINNLAFLTAVLFGLVGMEMSAIHADEVKNPAKAYPRAILISAVIILVSLIFASLAIALVVPYAQLNVVTGLMQAFALFFQAYHMHWMEPVIAVLIILGGISGVAAWIIGPTKGLLVAVRDGSAPAFLGKTNARDVPVVILILQALIFTVLCVVFLVMPSVSSSYWVLTAMTAQLAMLGYVAMFLAGIWLRYKKPEVARAYRVPGGNWGMWIVGLLGLVSSIAAIGLGFLPPSQINIGKLGTYEAILIIGILVLCLPPVWIYKRTLAKRNKNLIAAS